MRRLTIALALASAAVAGSLVPLGTGASSTAAASSRRAHPPAETTTWTAQVSETDTSLFAFKLPHVAAGTYLGTLSGMIYSGALNMQCVVTTRDLRHPLIADATTAVDGVHLFNGARTFRLATRQTLLLMCLSPDPESFDTNKRFPLEVSLTRLGSRETESARHTVIKSARAAAGGVLPRLP